MLRLGRGLVTAPGRSLGRPAVGFLMGRSPLQEQAGRSSSESWSLTWDRLSGSGFDVLIKCM